MRYVTSIEVNSCASSGGAPSHAVGIGLGASGAEVGQCEGRWVATRGEAPMSKLSAATNGVATPNRIRRGARRGGKAKNRGVTTRGEAPSPRPSPPKGGEGEGRMRGEGEERPLSAGRRRG